MEVGFIGLGAMGAPMAANLARRGVTRVWNRTADVAISHQQRCGSVAVTDLIELAEVDVIASCLPTDAEVMSVARELGPELRAGTVWVDHTSGDPTGTREVARLLAEHGVDYLDAPVSGGTNGAEAGTLTTMVGGEATALQRARPALEAVASTIVHVGPVGSGMAVKAVNNALLATSLWAAAEGLVALAKAGVPASTALEVINQSSGRSNATQNLLPERAVTRAFPFTFALSLLAKDVGLARSVLDDARIDGAVLRLVDELTTDAARELGPSADHVELVRIIEEAGGAELR